MDLKKLNCIIVLLKTEEEENMKEFNRVIGYDDVKVELERIIDMMINSEKYKSLGVQTTRGLLLHGDPGVGKTLMAKCFIKASKRPTFTVRKDLPDGDFVKYIKSTFEKAKKQAPSIVFLDDMDKFANEDEKHRNAEEFVTIQSCIDECKEDEVFVLATTNELRAIPRSLLRPGRFDKSIVIDNPEGEDAEKIIKHYLKKKKCGKDVEAKEVARLLNGRSCAALETVINEAGVYAGYENRKELSMNDLVRAFMRVIYNSPEKLKFKDSKYMLQTAYHEAGHTVVAETLEPGSVPFVTIKPHNGGMAGFAHIDNDENYFEDKQFMENRVISLLAGRAATEVVYGITDVGANNDIHRAFDIVQRFVDDYCTYGFTNWEGNSDYVPHALEEKRMNYITCEMERYYQQAKKIVIENRKYLDSLAKELFDKKVLLARDVQRLKIA